MNWTKILKFLIFVGVAILLHVPFIVSNGMFFPFITGKAYTFRVIVEIITFLYLIMAVINPEYRPKKSWMLYTFGLFTLSILVSNILGVNPTASLWSNFERMEGWVTIAHLLALFVALSGSLNKKKDWNIVFNISILFSFIMSFTAVSEILKNGWNFRVDTTLGNSTFLGIYALMNSFIALYLLFNYLTKDKFETDKLSVIFKRGFKSIPIWIYIIAFILNSVVMFQTGTRGSMLGWFGGLMLTALLMIFMNKGNKPAKISAGLVMLLIALVLGGIFLLKDAPIIKNNAALSRITDINLSEGTARARILNWQIATEGFKERPILGWGQSNFNYVFDKYYLPEHHGNEQWFDRTHNIFFDWLIAGGILGLVLYLSIWISMVVGVFKTSKLKPNEKAVFIGLLAAYFFHNLFVFDQISSYIYFALFLAFVNSFSDKEFTWLQKDLSRNTINVTVGILIVLLPITIYSINANSLESNRLLIDAMRLTKRNAEGQVTYFHENGLNGNIEYFNRALDKNTFGNSEIRQRALMMYSEVARIENIPDEDKVKFVQLVTMEMDKQIEEDPTNSRYHYMTGIFFANIGNIEIAEKYLLDAIKYSPNKQGIRLPLQKIYYKSNQGDKAIALAKETSELDESKTDLWLEYALALSKFDRESFTEMVTDEKEKTANGESIERLETLIKHEISNDPEKYQSQISLSALYMTAGMVDESLKILEQVKTSFPDISKEVEILISKIENGENPLGERI